VKKVGAMMALVAMLLAAACGSSIDSSGKARTRELQLRGFQSVQIEEASKGGGFMDVASATAEVSAGSCRFRMKWEPTRGWTLRDDGKAVNVPGELTAAAVLRLPPYRQCASRS
jgi:hypothetical protein